MGSILHVKMWIESTQNLETKNLVPRIQTAKLHGHTDNLQTGVKFCLPSYDLSVASTRMLVSATSSRYINVPSNNVNSVLFQIYDRKHKHGAIIR